MRDVALRRLVYGVLSFAGIQGLVVTLLVMRDMRFHLTLTANAVIVLTSAASVFALFAIHTFIKAIDPE